MEESNTDSFDRASTSSPVFKFGSALECIEFSDRDLRIEIFGPSNEMESNVLDVSISLQQQVLISDDVLPTVNPHVGPVPTGEESGDLDSSTLLSVKTLHVNSTIFAAKSPFFHKLFSNGMKESNERRVTLQIDVSEEAAVMELLNFMYNNCLSVTTAPPLLDVLMAADKYQVPSCMIYCCKQLQPLLATTESALLLLELPPSLLMAEEVQSVTATAKQYLATRYSDLVGCEDDILSLPLSGIDAILSSNHLQIKSEDSVFDLVMKWVNKHYPVLEERQEVLRIHLAKLIRFPYLSCRKLKELFYTNTEFDHDTASKVVMEALFFLAEPPHKQRALMEEIIPSRRQSFIKRTYKYPPVKMIELEYPIIKEYVVYLDLKREECTRLYPSGRIYSQAFYFGEHAFHLVGCCSIDGMNTFHSFGLFLEKQGTSLVPINVDYEFSVRSEPRKKFIVKLTDNQTFSELGDAFGDRNLLGIPWPSFMCRSSDYFINDTLHLRAGITIRP